MSSYIVFVIMSDTTMHWITYLIHLLEQFILWIGYPGLTVLLLIETFVPPIPGQLMLPFAGILIASGDLTFRGALIAGVAGETIGSILLYLVGRRFAEERLLRWVDRLPTWIPISVTQISNTRQRFATYGAVMVFLARMTPLPIVRTVVSLVAGLSAMSLLNFTILTAAGSITSVGIFLIAGFYLGENWQAVLAEFAAHPALWITLAAIAVFLLLLYRGFLFHRQRRLKASLNPHRKPEEHPI